MGSCLPVKVGKRKVAGRKTNWDSVNDGGGGTPVVTVCRYFWAIHIPARSGRSLSHNHFRLMHILRGGRNGLTRHYKIRVSLPSLSNLRVG